jgi:hypothetical protein
MEFFFKIEDSMKIKFSDFIHYFRKFIDNLFECIYIRKKYIFHFYLILIFFRNLSIITIKIPNIIFGYFINNNELIIMIKRIKICYHFYLIC